MKKNYCHIVGILDRSGSMSDIKNDVIGSYNEFLRKQREIDGKCTISLYQFDDRYDVVYENKDIKDAPKLTDKTFVPRGWTALLDAIGRTINTVGKQLYDLKESERPEKVVVFIQTDGKENQSKEFTRSQIFEMIKHQREKYKWEFVFLGADQDAISVGTSYGIGAANSMTFAKSSKGNKMAYCSLTSNLSSYRAGIKSDMSFTDEDKKRQNNELNK